MVELNNKLKLPNYTRFENKFLDNFDTNTTAKLESNFGVLSQLGEFNTSLDTSIAQVSQHLSRVSTVNELTINDSYSDLVNVNISGEKNFSAHTLINIEKSTNNKVLVEIDINSDISSNGIEIFADENSVTDVIINIQGTGKNSNFIKANVQKDATLNVYLINSYKNDLNDVSIALLGENSSSKLKTVAIAQDAKKFFSVRIDHFAKNSFGRIVNHGVGLDNSRLIINGFGKIHKDCKDSDNYQKSKVLSLSDTARVEANPILLIDEYDVVASHAASVSNVDPNQLYYLRSRGINQKDAQVLLIKGFLKTIVNEIDNEQIKENFENMLNEIIGYSNDI